MVKFIESELILLKKEIDEMWTLVYNQLDRAGEAVLTLDKELAQQVMVRERRVNAFELKIDSDVEDIIALYNPVAIDLRFVLAMLKINTNLERLGDFAEGIARFVLRCKEPVLDAELLSRLRLVENATNKTYPIVRPLYYYYNVKNKEQVSPLIQFILSSDGQDIIKKSGYIPVK